MSHTTLAEFPCTAGRGAEFLGALLPALADTRAFEGCEGIETYIDSDNPDQFSNVRRRAHRILHHYRDPTPVGRPEE